MKGQCVGEIPGLQACTCCPCVVISNELNPKIWRWDYQFAYKLWEF